MKSILVSGGTRGIGRAIVERFAAEGFNVAVCARTTDDLLALDKYLTNRYPAQRVLTFMADAAISGQMKAFGKLVLEEFGQVDVLVNNAGIFEPGQVLNEAEGVLEKLLQVNVSSAYHLTRAVVPHMLQRNTGHVFNICSTASITPYTNGGSYCISKFALLGMTRVLREELKQSGVRVTAVLPGATRTDSWAASDLPESRFMKPEDVASAIWNAWSLSGNTVVEELLLRPQLGDI